MKRSNLRKVLYILVTKYDLYTQSDNYFRITVLFCCLQIGVISYKARTLGASSGSPVMVTYRFENENVPMIVGVHSGSLFQTFPTKCFLNENVHHSNTANDRPPF
jgi:hypothetical protein